MGTKKRKQLKRANNKKTREPDLIDLQMQREIDCYEAFVKFDVSGDGNICYDEFIPIANHLGVDAKYADRAFRRFDTDHTRTLSRTEFVKLYNFIQRKVRGYEEPK